MSFEEWFEEYYGDYKYSVVKWAMKAAWNAAINSIKVN